MIPRLLCTVHNVLLALPLIHVLVWLCENPIVIYRDTALNIGHMKDTLIVSIKADIDSTTKEVNILLCARA